MKIISLSTSLIIILTLINCQQTNEISFKIVNNPSIGFSETPFISDVVDGKLILSWTEVENDSLSKLKFASFDGEEFSEAKLVSEGSDWFVNWADCPSVVQFKDSKHLIAHWLQKSANGTYDYDIRMSISNNSGESWSPSFILHDDNVAAEHGFVTIKAMEDQKVNVIWLDGRNTKNDTSKNFIPKMTLRGATIGSNGFKHEDVLIDSMVCDCCQTELELIASVPTVIYRDRTEEEVRDISQSRFLNGKWTEPSSVYEDGWMIPGCPVNGPRISSYGDKALISWYTESDKTPQVNALFINEEGKHLSKLIQIQSGSTIGRVDTEMLNDSTGIISWMSKTGTNATIYLSIVTISGEISEPIIIGENSPSRSSGFPVIKMISGKLLVAYSLVDGDNQKLITKSIDLSKMDY